MQPGTAAISGIEPRMATISFCTVGVTEAVDLCRDLDDIGVLGEDLLLASVELLLGLRADDAAVQNDVALAARIRIEFELSESAPHCP